MSEEGKHWTWADHALGLFGSFVKSKPSLHCSKTARKTKEGCFTRDTMGLHGEAHCLGAMGCVYYWTTVPE
eukprot:711695-Amphidinium_carterae.5